MILSSNEKRALLRQQCREALAAHIHDRLGLTVAPGRVRLQPSAADGYAWSVSKSQEYLLKTNLSNGTVGMYQAIRDALGCSIEAVSPQTLREPDASSDNRISDEVSHQGLLSFPNAEILKHPSSSKLPKPTRAASATDSFTATIQRLEVANQELTADVENARKHSETLLDERQEWEAKYRGIHEELENSKSLVTRLEEDLSRVQMGIAEAMETLKNHQIPENKQSCAPTHL
ncbi:hypothetical protein N7452_004194 [Penicillium brevicompactum]|uniref:Uncharacterized protein n=1 Tax=Penicillium brevicompactum TaxID=5074 RepID=A0A9W9QUX9_PENBR|nr:hypothetical protein N7452_004194 [Penicillium brevicompactum]